MHASALFNSSGELLISREDVGRHNALDKVVGNSLLNRQLPLSESILMLSGRISFELVQKATQAGIRIIVAVGAPSSLACELARKADLTLIGFVKHQSFNIYHGEWRIS
jgi:FdhD protein